MPPSLERTLQALKREIIALSETQPLAFVLFGSAATEKSALDVDIVIVLHDSTDPFQFIKLISPAVAKQTAASGRLFCCFPTSEANYLKPASQFLANVRAHGVEF